MSIQPARPWKSVAHGFCEKPAPGEYRPQLRANQNLLNDAGRPRTFVLHGVFLYDHRADRWDRVNIPPARPVTVDPVPRTVYSRQTDPVLFHLPKQLGLFWAVWDEDGHRTGALVFSGPFLCQDLMMGPAPKGRIPACVPFPNSALATFIPDPKIHCRE